MRVLIVDLWNGEGYSDSKAWIKDFKSEEKIRKYILKGVFKSSGGIDNLMYEFGNLDSDDTTESALIVKHNSITYLLGDDVGSYHYHVLNEDEVFIGVALYPDVNEYKIITDQEEWDELERFKNNDDFIADMGIVLLFDYETLN